MQVGQDNWCPKCISWMPFDENGNCKTCGIYINIISKQHPWFEEFGIEKRELVDGDFN
jgi:hypothetical protein